MYAAVMVLPEKQARRVYARFYLEMDPTEIARAQGIHASRSSASIRSGLQNLPKVFLSSSRQAEHVSGFPAAR